MAKIEVQIDVEAAQFIAFYQKFKEYSASAEKMPGQWRDVAKSAKSASDSAQKSASASQDSADATDRASRSMVAVRRLSESASQAWLTMRNSTAKVAANVADITSSLLKWTGVTSLVGGLAGAGGLFGMDALARNVSSGRSAAMGLGSSYGERRSFLLNYGRFGDAESVLANVNQQKYSANKQALRNIGFTDYEINHLSSAELAARYEEKVQQQSKSVNPAMLSNWMRMRNVDQVMSLQDVERLRATPNAEMSGVRGRYNRDVKRFGLSKEQQSNWQEFETTLRSATKSIQTLFIAALGRLTPGLTALSNAFTDLLDRVQPNSKKGGPLDRWLDSLNKGLETFAKYLGSDEAKTQIVKFFKGLKSIAEIVWRFVKGAWSLAKGLGFVTDAQAAGYAGPTGGSVGSGSSVSSPYGGLSRTGLDAAPSQGAAILTGGALSSFPRGKDIDPEVVEYIRKAAEARGIDPRVALGVAKSEGLKGFSPSKGTWSAGSNDYGTSFGPLQAHFKSNIPGMRASGQGDRMLREGINARDISQWKKVIDWQLDYAKQHGWREWHGWRGAARAGLDYKPSTRSVVKVTPSIGSNPFIGAGGAFVGAQ